MVPRRNRFCTGGYVYHVLNRAVGKAQIFAKEADYLAFEYVVREALEKHPTRLLSYCIMPNHWHFVVWPRRDDELSEFFRWLTVTHTQRWHAQYGTSGSGPIYQGRFKSFPIQEDNHFLTVSRYVERNALRANLVARAENWKWSSLWQRENCKGVNFLADWPVRRPLQWLDFVNGTETAAEVAAIRRCVTRGSPYGGETWVNITAAELGLESSLRPPGRPKKRGP